MSGRVRGQRSSCSTAAPATTASGVGNSMRFQTSSLSWRGTRQGAVNPQIRQSSSVCQTTPTVSRDSSRRSVWSGRMCWGCPLAVGLLWNSIAAILRFHSRSSWPRPMRAGLGLFQPRWSNERLRQVLREADLPVDQWAPGWLPGLLSAHAPAGATEELIAIMSDAHPAGMRVMARAFAEADLRDILGRIAVPTLLLYGGVRSARPPERRRGPPHKDSRIATGGHAWRWASKQHGRARPVQSRGAHVPQVAKPLREVADRVLPPSPVSSDLVSPV